MRQFSTTPSKLLSPKAFSGNMALRYAMLDTAIASNFFTKRADCECVTCSLGNISDH